MCTLINNNEISLIGNILSNKLSSVAKKYKMFLSEEVANNITVSKSLTIKFYDLSLLEIEEIIKTQIETSLPGKQIRVYRSNDRYYVDIIFDTLCEKVILGL